VSGSRKRRGREGLRAEHVGDGPGAGGQEKTLLDSARTRLEAITGVIKG
jgi:hypothetical protein